jgi:NTE family protein
MAALTSAPDALVLGGGGILGEAWMNAVLVGLAERSGVDARACDCFVGTSAGSIVAASLAAGVDPAERVAPYTDATHGSAGEDGAAGGDRGGDRDPHAGAGDGGASAGDGERARGPSRAALETAMQLGGAAAAPLAALALGGSAPGGALLRRALLRGVRPGRQSLERLGELVEDSGVQFDGRLLIVAVELESGRRTVFGAPGAPSVSVATAVRASCAIPGYFEPVLAGGRAYVDGGAWSPTNMDVVHAGRGGRVLCLNPTGSLPGSLGTLAGALGPLSRGIAAGEALALRHRGVSVTTVSPDACSAAAMGANLMDPRPRGEVVAAGIAQGRALAPASSQHAA